MLYIQKGSTTVEKYVSNSRLSTLEIRTKTLLLEKNFSQVNIATNSRFIFFGTSMYYVHSYIYIYMNLFIQGADTIFKLLIDINSHIYISVIVGEDILFSLINYHQALNKIENYWNLKIVCSPRDSNQCLLTANKNLGNMQEGKPLGSIIKEKKETTHSLSWNIYHLIYVQRS